MKSEEPAACIVILLNQTMLKVHAYDLIKITWEAQ